MAKLKDPVAGAVEESAIKTVVDDDLEPKAVRPSAARVTNPFDGYPFKKKIKVGEYVDPEDRKKKDSMISASFIVILNPTVQVRQDKSNTKYPNYHSRAIRDYEERDNTIIVFDRKMEIKGKTYLYAVVPSHNVRAQLFFKYDNNKQRIEVVSDYLLLDTEQESRLRRVFEQVINPKLKIEREASFISGESKVDTGEGEPLTEDEV